MAVAADRTGRPKRRSTSGMADRVGIWTHAERTTASARARLSERLRATRSAGSDSRPAGCQILQG